MSSQVERILGQDIHNYRVVRKLGEGGMGAVFEGVHQMLGRSAAIKILLPEVAAHRETVQRFLNEARAANQIRHPGVVQIYDCGHLSDRSPFLIMEYLEGETLHSALKRAASQPSGCIGIPGLTILKQTASALHAAHQHGIIHRDLKPGNLMLVADPDIPGGIRVKVLDFGIAKILSPLSAAQSVNTLGEVRTQTGLMMGTPSYMAPEQWASRRDINGKVDCYALGVVAYQVLAGRLPFDIADTDNWMALHMFHTPVPLESIDPTLPRELSALVARMLAKNPADRPSMQEVLNTLQALITPGTTSSVLSVSGANTVRSVQFGRKRHWAAGAALLTLAAGAGTLGRLYINRVAPRPAHAGLAANVAVAVPSAARTPDMTPRPPLSSPAASPPAPPKPNIRTDSAQEHAGTPTVHWNIGSEPPGAIVWRVKDQRVLGETPWHLEQPMQRGSIRVVLRHDGYQDKLLELSTDRAVDRKEKLQPLPVQLMLQAREAQPRKRLDAVPPPAVKLPPLPSMPARSSSP